MKTRFVALFVLFGLLAVCSPIFAHHGAAAYDESKEVVLKGATVTKFSWANPHSIIQFDVKDDNGKVVHWAGELGSPSAITLQGWTKVSVQPGEEAAVPITNRKPAIPSAPFLTSCLPMARSYTIARELRAEAGAELGMAPTIDAYPRNKRMVALI